MPIVVALGGYRKEGKELKVILGYIVYLVNLSYVSQKNQKTKYRSKHQTEHANIQLCT